MTRVLLAAALVSALFARPAAVAAQTPPTAAVALTPEEILARSRAAEDAGTRAETEREVWATRVAGLEGTLEILRRGESTVTLTSLGPFKTARGTAHAERWHQNENGETILDRAEPSQTEHAVTQTAARVREPVDAWMIATTFASGHVTRFYYDPKTFFVIRTERTAAGRTSHLTFDDFRTDARGRTRYWHYSGSDDRGDNDVDYRLTRDDPGAEVSEADVAVPRDRRTLVEFPAGAETVRLPARIEDDRIYVRVDIGGRGLDFLLDTGSSNITLDADVARELKLPEYGRVVQTVAGSFTAGRVVAPEVGIGALTLHDLVMHTVPFASKQAHDTRAVGLLGFDFIDAVGLKIDYASGTVDAARPGAETIPPGAAALDVRLNSGAPVVHASLGDAAGDDFILDTGAAYPYVVFQRFARTHPSVVAPPGASARTVSANGVGGTMLLRRTPPKRVVLGTLAFDEDAGAEALSPNAFGFDNEDGLIGAEILKYFTMYVDYAADRISLVPNGRAPVVELAPGSLTRGSVTETPRPSTSFATPRAVRHPEAIHAGRR